MTLLTDFFLYLTGYIIQGIGIDDMFIMTAVWHRTNPNLSASKRLAVTLSEAATAVSITSITDLVFRDFSIIFSKVHLLIHLLIFCFWKKFIYLFKQSSRATSAICLSNKKKQ